MAAPKLTRLELQIMETLWTKGDCSIREIQEAFPEKGRPAYTTVQTTVYRLEGKKVVERVKRIGNSHIFAATVSRNAAQRRLVSDLLALFGGRIHVQFHGLAQFLRLSAVDGEHERFFQEQVLDRR